MMVEKSAGRSHRGWGLAALAVLAFALSAVTLIRSHRAERPVQATISAGIAEGQRAETLAKFVMLAAPHGIILKPVQTSGSTEALERVSAGTLDLAVIQGGIDFSGYPNVRQVTSLQIMPLHLLVKDELADEVTTHLGALRGKVVNLGSGEGSSTFWLASEVLSFAGLGLGASGQPGDFQATTFSPVQLVMERDRARLPDAIFAATVMPNTFVRQMVARRYRLVPLLFRDAFTLGAMAEPVREPGDERAAARRLPTGSDERPTILREQIADTVIPAFTYQADPGVPPAPLHTLGTKALLVANHRLEPDVVVRILAVLFQTRYAKIVQPPLDVHRLEEIPEIPWHPGSVAYLERSKPVLTGEFVSELVNLCSIAGPILGGVLFLWQYIRRRSRFRSEKSFEAYIGKVSALEQAALDRVRTHEGRLDPAELARLAYALGQLKTEAVDKFAHGEITGETLLTSFLTHVSDARAHLVQLSEIARDSRDEAGPGAERNDHQQPPAVVEQPIGSAPAD
jgi:TRAP-type uncharacterized transport system substrate-binding protein